MRQKNIYNEIGGPIRKEKLFFCGDYDGVTVDNAINAMLLVPTADMRAGNLAAFNTPAMIVAKSASYIYDPRTGDAAGANKTMCAGNVVSLSRSAPAARLLLQNLPLKNYGAAGSSVNNYFGSAVNAFKRQSADIIITYVPTNSTSFFGRYSLSPSAINDPQEFGINPGGGTFDGGQPGAATGLIQNIGLGTTHTFTPHLLIDVTRAILGSGSLLLQRIFRSETVVPTKLAFPAPTTAVRACTVVFPGSTCPRTRTRGMATPAVRSPFVTTSPSATPMSHMFARTTRFPLAVNTSTAQSITCSPVTPRTPRPAADFTSLAA